MKSELKAFYNEKSLTATAMSFEPISDEKFEGIEGPFTTNAANDADKQQYYNLRMTAKNTDGELTGGSGRTITKTVFERTHPGAFKFIEDMQSKGVPIRTIKGLEVTVDTTRPFDVLMRDRDASSATFGKLIRVKKRDGSVMTASKMRIFLFQDEDKDAELTRRANQLTAEKAWHDVSVPEGDDATDFGG